MKSVQSKIGLEVFPTPTSKQVLEFSIPTNNTTYMLDVSNLTKGIYIFQIADNSGLLKTEKMMVEYVYILHFN